MGITFSKIKNRINNINKRLYYNLPENKWVKSREIFKCIFEEVYDRASDILFPLWDAFVLMPCEFLKNNLWRMLMPLFGLPLVSFHLRKDFERIFLFHTSGPNTFFGMKMGFMEKFVFLLDFRKSERNTLRNSNNLPRWVNFLIYILCFNMFDGNVVSLNSVLEREYQKLNSLERKAFLNLFFTDYNLFYSGSSYRSARDHAQLHGEVFGKGPGPHNDFVVGEYAQLAKLLVSENNFKLSKLGFWGIFEKFCEEYEDMANTYSLANSRKFPQVYAALAMRGKLDGLDSLSSETLESIYGIETSND